MHGITCHGGQCQSWDFNLGLLILSQPQLLSLCNSAVIENYPHGADCTFGKFQSWVPLHAEVVSGYRESIIPCLSPRTLLGPSWCKIYAKKKEWTGLGGHSVLLENLKKIKYYSKLFYPPAKSPCQSIWSRFWASGRAEMTSSLL